MMNATRLINVSNRLPIVIDKDGEDLRLQRASGGLATAVEAMWKGRAGIWVGWSGIDDDPRLPEVLAQASRERQYQMRSVSLTAEEISKFYNGFANEIIWPLFHDLPSPCNFDPSYWEAYQHVNGKFAQAVADMADPKDVVWVHDYHLMLVAKQARQLNVKSRMGFFLHIPFPAPDVFEKLPWREAVLRGLLAFDLVGFQTDRDRNNFSRCLEKLIPEARVESRAWQQVVWNRGRPVVAGTYPISIDYNAFDAPARRPEVAQRSANIRNSVPGKWLVLGVDRLDYTKGIPERLRAFRLALEQHPELRQQITLVQVVVPSRSDIPKYKDLKQEIERLVSGINGEFTQPGWVPIHYLHRSLERDELVAYYCAADIALITSLKDGMNLVAKEYCASHVDEQGVLILSEFAGAGPELREGALLVNPNDFTQVADSLVQACQMSTAEKQRRMRAMRLVVKHHNVERWAASFLEALKPQSELLSAVAGKPVAAPKNPFRLLWDTGRFLMGKKAAGMRETGPEALSNSRVVR